MTEPLGEQRRVAQFPPGASFRWVNATWCPLASGHALLIPLCVGLARERWGWSVMLWAEGVRSDPSPSPGILLGRIGTKLLCQGSAGNLPAASSARHCQLQSQRTAASSARSARYLGGAWYALWGHGRIRPSLGTYHLHVLPLGNACPQPWHLAASQPQPCSASNTVLFHLCSADHWAVTDYV